jgi:D-sedoheptulose 7-phosphate isomerase
VSLLEEVKKAKRVYLIGNGGSYANAFHMANDLASCGVKAHVLEPSTLTAWANDHGYENVFLMQIETYGEAGDLLIAMSGSGQSTNILKACAEAERKGMTVWKIFGNERGEDMQRAEESQVNIGHDLMRSLRKSS